MGFLQLLKQRGRAVSDHYAGTADYFYLTPASLVLLRGLQPLIESSCAGRILDAGAGREAYRHILEPRGKAYVGMDLVVRSTDGVIGDVQGLPFREGTFDTVFCSQVLEHVPDPERALAEFKRVLAPGGVLILSVPHISWLHNEPHDYYRFTCHGLKYLFRKQGFDMVTLAPAGGLFCLLGHIASTVWVNLLFGLPIPQTPFRFLNRCWAKLVAFVDRVCDRKKIFALNYVCVARPRATAPPKANR